MLPLQPLIKAVTFSKVRLKFGEKEDWQSDRMRWTRNPVYPFPGIGGLNPSSSAMIFNL